MACENLLVSMYKSSTGEPIYRLKLEEQHEAQPRTAHCRMLWLGCRTSRQGLVSAALSPDATTVVLVDAKGDVLLVDWAQEKAPRALAACPRRMETYGVVFHGLLAAIFTMLASVPRESGLGTSCKRISHQTVQRPTVWLQMCLTH